ncbi:MAG: DinB family protein, partial [Phycisphaerales bacterium]
FRVDFPVGKFPDILSRYRGTAARVDEAVSGQHDDALRWHDAPGTWSIKQNIGHLLDLEPLWEGRVDDYLAGVARLRAADMTNAATHAAGYDARSASELLHGFREARRHIVGRLESLGESDWARVSEHPRLNQRMRLVDAVAFTCDHDDYHLARIDELARGFALAR